MGDGIERRFRLAEEIIREAGKLARAYFENRHSLTIESKGAQDFVSRADKETEALIVSRLSLDCPQDGILGEEGGRYDSKGHGDAGHSVWVIDPIDGTANFLRGIPFWCISLALVHEGRLELGLIYDPVHDELFAGRRGHGARRIGPDAKNGGQPMPQPMQVTGASDFRQGNIGLGYGMKLSREQHVGSIDALLLKGCEYRRLGSGALGLAYVADGRLDGFYESRLNAWDVLGGLLLVSEAGGRQNDFLANDGLNRGNPVLAATPAFYDPLARLFGL